MATLRGMSIPEAQLRLSGAMHTCTPYKSTTGSVVQREWKEGK